jgi:hypothetical protein
MPPAKQHEGPQINAPGNAHPASGSRATDGSTPGRAVVGYSLKNDISTPLHSVNPLPPAPNKGEDEPENLPIDRPGKSSPFTDHALQTWLSPLAMPTPLSVFPGISFTGFMPADPNGDVGPDHYVQWVNTSFRIFTKTGVSVYGPAAGNTLWAGFGGPCESSNDGDPIVLYDSIAGRWLMSQFALPGGVQGYYQCIAISLTSDPTSSYYRYAFQMSPNLLNDYPKFGVWPDAYYMSTVNFSSSTYTGPSAVAFDRARMLAGQPATFQRFNLSPTFGPILPSDLDGSTPPPAGAPNLFAGIDDNGSLGSGSLNLWRFHVDWTTPANSTLTGPTTLSTQPFNSDFCTNSREACIAQPSGPYLEAISDRPMYRLAYRNFGSHESLVANHTVSAPVGTGYAGIRWYELRGVSATPTIYQQGTYAPLDGDERWMGSIAMDHVGNIALGYSASGLNTHPSIRYTGRLSTDPLGSLPQGEVRLADGGSSQQTFTRWGDYSMLTVDPTDDCTFWFTHQFTPAGVGVWDTRIASFRFPSCTHHGTSTPTGTPSHTGTPTNTHTPTSTATPFNASAYAFVQPAGPITVTLGSKFTLELRVNSGSNDVVGAQSYMTFTNSVLQHVDALQPGCVPTSTVRADVGIFDTVLQNEVCNSSSPCDFGRITAPPGSVAFASGVLLNPPARGSFRVAQLAFCGVATGQAIIHWEFSPPSPDSRDSQVVDQHGNVVSDPALYSDYVVNVVNASPTPAQSATPTRTSTPTLTPSATSTSTGTPALVGHVTWQGPPAQPNARQQLPITLTLKSATVEVNFGPVTTDASGFFTVPVGSLAPGTYDWRAKGSKYLANAGSLTLSGGSGTNLEIGLMRAGDANNDNVVTALDFSILRSAFGGTADLRADFNNDGTVSATDFSLLRNNFGQGGAPPAGP